MASEDIRLQLYLEAQKESLTQIQNDLKRALKGVKLEVEPKISSKLKRGKFLEVGNEVLQSALAQANKAQTESAFTLADAYDKHVAALFIATFGAKTAAESLKQVNEALRNHKSSVKKAVTTYTVLNVATDALAKALEFSRDITANTAGRLAKIVPGGLSSALAVLEKEADAAASTFGDLQTQKNKEKTPAKAFDLAVEKMRVNIVQAQKGFEQLGFTAQDSSKLLQIATNVLIEKIGKTQFANVEESRKRPIAQNRAGEIDISGAPIGIPKAPKKAAVSAAKELEGLANIARIQAKALGSGVQEFALLMNGAAGKFALEVTASGRGLKDATVRILNQAERAIGGLVLDKDGNVVRAEGALISEMYAQITSLQKSIDSELAKTNANQDLVKSQRAAIESIRKSIDGFQSLSAPLVPLSTRVAELAFQFGETPIALRNFINATFRLVKTEGQAGVQLENVNHSLDSLSAAAKALVTEVEGGLNIDQARALVKKFGSNFDGLVKELLPDHLEEKGKGIAGIEALEAQRAELLQILNNAYKKDIDATNKAASAAAAEAAGRKRTSNTIAKDANPVVNAEIAKFQQELNDNLASFKGQGAGAARYARDINQFSEQMNLAKVLFLSGLDQAKVEFFNLQDGGKALAEAMKKLRKGFEKEFVDEIGVIQKAQQKEEQRIFELNKKIANAREAILKGNIDLLAAVHRNVIDQATKPQGGFGLNLSALKDLKLPDLRAAASPIFTAFKSFADNVINAGQQIKNRPLIEKNKNTIQAENNNLNVANNKVAANQAVVKEYLKLKEAVNKAKQEHERYAKQLSDARAAQEKEFNDWMTQFHGGKSGVRESSDGSRREAENAANFAIQQKHKVGELFVKEGELAQKLGNLQERELKARIVGLRAVQEITANQHKARNAEANIARAKEELARLEQKRISQAASQGAGPAVSRASGGTNNLVNVVKNLFKKKQEDTVQAELKSFADIEKVGKTLDASGQDRFLKALRGQAHTLKEVNNLFKQHQGNLAKSGALVDRLTAGMRSGEKAAFQFGFAAANAAERLTAWASPASFLFGAVSLLREAATGIVKLDTELRKLVFFSPEFVASQIAALRGLDETVKQRVTTDRAYAESLNKSAGAAELNVAKNLALAASFELVIQRSRDTGLSIDEISAGLLTTSRVGRAAFERNAETGELMVSTFFLAVEGFKRLEGAAANVDTVVSLLNSTLNEFALSGDNAVAVTAAITDAAGKSALEGQELFDVLVRTGAAFSLLTGASVGESLAVIQRSSEATIPSVSKLATAIRQFTTLAIDNSDAIERFSGIQLIQGGQIKDMETFVAVLGKLKELAPAARNEFLKLFSERDTGATVLALATQFENINADLQDLADVEKVVARAFDQTKGFMEQQLFQQEDLQSSINKLKAALAGLIKDSGFSEFLQKIIRSGTGMVGIVGDIAGQIEKTIGLFKLVAAIAAPTIINLVKGFQKGFLSRQNSFKVEQEIIDALRQEGGLHQAINTAQVEGLLLSKEATAFRLQNLRIGGQLLQINEQEVILKSDLAIFQKDEIRHAAQIKKVQSDLKNIEIQKLGILKEENALRGQIEQKAISSAAKTQASVLAGFKNTLISAGSFAAITVLPGAVNEVASRISGDKKVGSTVEKVFQGAVFGALAGGAFGGIPAIGTAIIGGLGAFYEARKDATRDARDLAEVESQAQKAADLARKNFNAQEETRTKIKEDITKAEAAILDKTAEIEKVSIEINRIGAQRAEQEGLIEKRQELQEELIRAQLQLRIREKAEIAETLAFEEARTAIRERLVTVEKALSIQRNAQLSLAKSFKDTKLAVELEINFDQRQIALQKKALQDDLNEVVNRLGALRGEKGKAQQVKDLEKERLRISAEIIRLELDAVEARRVGAEKIAENAEKSAEEQITAWTNASNLVVSAFRSVISAQIEISKIIERQGDTLRNIIDEETKLLLLKADNPNAGLNASDRETGGLNIQRSSLARQLANVQATFNKQRALVESKSLSDVESAAVQFRDNLRKANVGLGEFATVLDEGQRKTFKALENERATLEANIEATKANISLQLDFTNKIIDIRRREIEIINKSVEIQRKRNEQDAELGRKLLKTPDAFLSEIKNLSTAQQFVRGLPNGDTAGLEDRIRQFQKNGAGGFVLLNRVLEGLESAVKQGLVLNKGFNPEELLQVFSRLQFQSAEDVKGTTNAEKTLIGSVEAVTSAIIDKFNEQSKLLNEEKSIQEQIKLNGLQLNGIAQIQADTLATMADSAIVEAKRTREENRNTQKEIFIRLEDKLKDLKLDNIITAGDHQITNAINSLGGIMAEIRESSPDVRARRKELKELGTLILTNLATQTQVDFSASNGSQANKVTDIEEARKLATNAKNLEADVAARLKKLRGTIKGLEEESDSFLNIFNQSGSMGRQDSGGDIITTLNPVTGQKTGPTTALRDVNAEIKRLEELAKFSEEKRKDFDRQVSVLSGIETNAKRIADIQNELQLFLSNDAVKRAEQARQLIAGIETGFNVKLVVDAYRKASDEIVEAIKSGHLSDRASPPSAPPPGPEPLPKLPVTPEAAPRIGIENNAFNQANFTEEGAKKILGEGRTTPEALLAELENAHRASSPTPLPTIPRSGFAGITDPDAFAKAFADAVNAKSDSTNPFNGFDEKFELFPRGVGERLARFLNDEAASGAAEKAKIEAENRLVPGDTKFIDASVEREYRENAHLINDQLREMTEKYGIFAEKVVAEVADFLKQRQPGDGPVPNGFNDVANILDFLKEQQMLLESQKVGIELDDASIDKLKEGLDESFERFMGRLDETRLKVDIPEVAVQLDANIKQQLQGDEFAQQLAAAFQGTGLEDRVDDIQGVVAKLVETALGRGESFSGVDVISFGGRLS